MQDGQIDYSKYSQASLEDCVISVNAADYPLNAAAVKSEIARRKLNGEWSHLDEKLSPRS